MSSTLGSMSSAWAPTTPLPPSIPARPVLAEAAIKRGRGGRPINAPARGGNPKRGRGAISSPTPGTTTNGTMDTTRTSLPSDVNSNPSVVSSERTTLSSITMLPSLPSRPPRPVPRRAKISVPKIDVITKTEPAPSELTPMRPSQRRRGKASPRALSAQTLSKPSVPAGTSDASVSSALIPEPPTPSSATAESPHEANPLPSNIENSSISPILDVPTTRQDATSLTLPSPSDSTYRPNTPSTHSHIDWADDDDDAGLPDLDDWGFASKPARRRSSAAKSPVISTTTPIPPISIDLVTSPNEGAPSSSLSVPNPDDTPNGNAVELSTRKPKGRPPLDPARVAEKKKLRNERAKERRKKKVDSATPVDGRPNSSRGITAAPPLQHVSNRPVGKVPDTPPRQPFPAVVAEEATKPKATDESATTSITTSIGSSTQSGVTREHIPSSVLLPSEVPQSTSDAPYHQNLIPTTLSVPTQLHTSMAIESTSTSPSNSASIPSRPSSSSREPFRLGGVGIPQNTPASGAPNSRHSPSPTKFHINGRHTHTHSHSMTRPIISPNALSQITKSLSGGTRQHRPAVSAE